MTRRWIPTFRPAALLPTGLRPAASTGGLPAPVTVAVRVRATRRTSRAGAFLLAAAAILAPPLAGQVVIDDFSVGQALFVVDPTPDASSSVAGSMLGGRRDAALERTEGPGPVVLDVSSGQLHFDVADASRGRLVLTWDGDADPMTLDPMGLGNADLSFGGASAFRLAAGSPSDPVDAVIEVFSDAGRSSRAALRIPLGPAADHLVAFSELVPRLGAGADFADVGAITLTLTALGVPPSTAVQIQTFDTVAPDLAATKTDALTVDADGDVAADPGDTLTYTITITNPGGEALAVDLADMVDPNTTLVAGSVSSTPIAHDDQYTAVGNVTLVVDGTPLAGVLADDDDPDGDPLTVTAMDPFSVRGGPVLLDDAATGAFRYTPPAGFNGVDTFSYTVEDDDGNAATGEVTVLVEGTVWFVDNTNTCGVPPCGVGTQADPFRTLLQAQDASAAGDVIRVRQGDGTSTGYEMGFVMQQGQRLVGGAADLVVGGDLIEAGAGPGGHSVHAHAGGGNVLDLASDGIVEGVRLAPTASFGLAGTGTSNVVADDVVVDTAGTAGGISLAGHSGGFTFSNGTVTSTAGASGPAVAIAGGSGVFDFSGSPIANDGGGLIHVQGANAATVDFTGSSPTLTNGSDDGILLELNTGGSTFTFDAIGDVATGNGNGVFIFNSGTVTIESVGNVAATVGAALDVAGTTVVKGGAAGPVPVASLSSILGLPGDPGVHLVGVAPGITVAGATVVRRGGGVHLEASGPVTFAGPLHVVAEAGRGLSVASSGLVSVLDATSSVEASGPGLVVHGSALDVTLARLRVITGLLEAGVRLVGVTGTLTVADGEVLGIGGTGAGPTFQVSGGAPTVQFGATVTQDAAERVVDVAGTTGGAVTLSAAVSGGQSSTGVRIHDADGDVSFADLDLGTSGARMATTALTLTGGSAGTFTFADTQIFTNNATGLDANDGGILEIVGAGNRVDTTNGIAVQLQGGTTIGPSGVTFERVDASGSTHGIRLNGAGSGFTVTGLATTDGSGGTIQNVSQRGIEILSTNDISLANMTLANAATTDGAGNCDNLVNSGCHAAVHLDTVSGASFDNVDIDGSVQIGLNGVAVSSLSLADSSILSAGDEVNEGGLQVFGLSGTSDITDSDIGFPSERAAYVRNVGAAHLDLTVTGSTFRDTQSSGLGADGLELAFFGSSTATVDVVDSFFRRNATNGLQVISEDTSVVGIDITGSTFDREAGIGIGMDLATADSGSLTFNVVGNPLITSRGSNAVNVFAIGPSTIQGRITNNPDIRAGGTGTGGFGIRVQVNENARGIVEISGNTVSDVGNDAGIQAIARGLGGASCGTSCTAGRLDATIRDNDVTIDASGLYDVWVQASDSNTTCADVTANAGSGAGIAAFRERTNAATSTVLLQGFTTDAVTTWNNNGNTPLNSVSSSNNGTLAGATCTTVSHPLP